MAKKAKTYKAAKKRFKVTGSGKLKHKKQGDNAHLKVNKSRATKARKKKPGILSNSTQAKKIKQMIS